MLCVHKPVQSHIVDVPIYACLLQSCGSIYLECSHLEHSQIFSCQRRQQFVVGVGLYIQAVGMECQAIGMECQLLSQWMKSCHFPCVQHPNNFDCCTLHLPADGFDLH